MSALMMFPDMNRGRTCERICIDTYFLQPSLKHAKSRRNSKIFPLSFCLITRAHEALVIALRFRIDSAYSYGTYLLRPSSHI